MELNQYRSVHLDLGCGANPRNPFNAEKVFGLDVIKRDGFQGESVTFVSANLAIHKIPFPDNHFDSITAYDFLEHIPRMIFIDGRTELAFVNLVSEIYRVLKPNGQFYAITPYFPMEAAFVDPTHVNFISQNTHKYFTSPHLWAAMYGYTGNFDVLRVEKVNFDLELNKNRTVKTFLRSCLSFVTKYSKQHIVWHFKANKQK